MRKVLNYYVRPGFAMTRDVLCITGDQLMQRLNDAVQNDNKARQLSQCFKR